MKKLLWNMGLACLAATLLRPGPAWAKLNVVATTPDLAALAQAVGGDQVGITVLAKATEDPHFLDPKPSFIVKLNRADALLEGGAELEIGWLSPLLEGARNPQIAAQGPGRIVASQGIQMLEVPAALDRSQGDLHALGNPHFVTDPLNALIVAEHIGEAFCQLDPASANQFRANAKAFRQRLEAKLVEWQRLLGPFQGRRVVAYHNIWPYFARRFGLKIDLFLEPKPGIPPTPAHLAQVVGTMQTEKVRVILVEPFQNRRTAEKVAEETGAAVLDVTQYPGGVKGTEGGYIELLDFLVQGLAKALGSPAN
jgi:zinc/manganese transport system substrate-binding protein